MIMRQETGPLEINNDWPGIFFRGDEALAHAHLLRILASGLDDPMIRKSAVSYLERLAAQLEGCWTHRAETAA